PSLGSASTAARTATDSEPRILCRTKLRGDRRGPAFWLGPSWACLALSARYSFLLSKCAGGACGAGEAEVVMPKRFLMAAAVLIGCGSSSKQPIQPIGAPPPTVGTTPAATGSGGTLSPTLGGTSGSSPSGSGSNVAMAGTTAMKPVVMPTGAS